MLDLQAEDILDIKDVDHPLAVGGDMSADDL